MPQVLLLDNYDSFTFNLAQALQVLGAEVWVHRNDTLTVGEALDLQPTHIVVSPGPGRPVDAGISVPLIREALGAVPILGVCLGHQSLGEALGGTVDYAPALMHGKASDVRHDGTGLFAGMPQPMPVARYHSLVVRDDDLPGALEVTARTDDGVVMALQHRSLPVAGVQFHPESVLTPDGPRLLANFLAW